MTLSIMEHPSEEDAERTEMRVMRFDTTKVLAARFEEVRANETFFSVDKILVYDE
jgi:hypothetical protein